MYHSVVTYKVQEIAMTKMGISELRTCVVNVTTGTSDVEGYVHVIRSPNG